MGLSRAIVSLVLPGVTHTGVSNGLEHPGESWVSAGTGGTAGGWPDLSLSLPLFSLVLFFSSSGFSSRIAKLHDRVTHGSQEHKSRSCQNFFRLMPRRAAMSFCGVLLVKANHRPAQSQREVKQIPHLHAKSGEEFLAILSPPQVRVR